MIARMHRFHGFNALRHVYSHGRSVRCTVFALKFVPNDRRSSFRVAVVVSRKVHKSAVVRNRIRRRIYEIIRRHSADIGRPYDMVVTVFSDVVAEMDGAKLESMLLEQLGKANIIPGTRAKAHGESHAIVVPKENQ
jgi:ribonuclease P protein component